MGKFSSLKEAQDFFVKDRFATVNGMRIDELNDNTCVCSVDITDDHRNAIGGVMGGVIFTLADLTFAAASNNAHFPTVALDVNIHFLSSTKGSKLTARSECIKNGRTTSVYNITITDDTGRDVAMFIGTGYKLQN